MNTTRKILLSIGLIAASLVLLPRVDSGATTIDRGDFVFIALTGVLLGGITLLVAALITSNRYTKQLFIRALSAYRRTKPEDFTEIDDTHHAKTGTIYLVISLYVFLALVVLGPEWITLHFTKIMIAALA